MDDFGFNENAIQDLHDALKKMNDSISSFDADEFDKSLESINARIKADTEYLEGIAYKPEKEKKKGGLFGALHGKLFNKK